MDIKIDESERLASRKKGSNKFIKASGFIVILLVIIASIYVLYEYRSVIYRQMTGTFLDQSQILSEIGISNLSKITMEEYEYANRISKQKCDWDANYRLADSLAGKGYRKQAASLFINYDDFCSPSNVAVRAASSLLLDSGEYEKALTYIDKYIQYTIEDPNGHYQKGIILFSLKRFKEAAPSFYTAINLFKDVSRINWSVFKRLSESYRMSGDVCEAITPIQIWMSASLARSSDPQAVHLISDLRKEGGCLTSYASGEGVFPANTGSGVIIAKVKINSTTGRFVVDTGAAMVALSEDFAERAKLDYRNGEEIITSTANGLSKARYINLEQVGIGNVSADKVAAAVLEKDALGNDIDGLLGRSFLSRFNVSFEGNTWRLTARDQ